LPVLSLRPPAWPLSAPDPEPACRHVPLSPSGLPTSDCLDLSTACLCWNIKQCYFDSLHLGLTLISDTILFTDYKTTHLTLLFFFPFLSMVSIMRASGGCWGKDDS
jgi:hypothetical protein